MPQTIVNLLIENTLIFSALFGGVLLIKFVFKKHLSALMQYALWAVVVIRLLIPVSFTTDWSPVNLIQNLQSIEPAIQTVDTLNSRSAIPQIPGNPDRTTDITQPASAIGSGADLTLDTVPAPVASPIQIDWTAVAVYVWLGGILLYITWLGLKTFKLKKKIMRCTTAEAPRWMRACFRQCKDELCIRRDIRLVLQGILPTPAIMGIFKPVLILPDTLIYDKNPEQMRHIFTHELMHYKRKDLLAIWGLNILNAVYWFNPLVWLCFSLIRRDMETACDHMVVQSLGSDNRKGYILTILKFSENQNNIRVQAAMSLNDGCRKMQKRIKGMYMRKKTKAPIKTAIVTLAMIMTFAAFTSGCQPTPNKPAVINKNDGQLEEKIQATPRALGNVTSSASSAVTGNTAAMQTTKKITEKFDTGTGIVDMDADVVVPASSDLPVATVGKTAIQQGDVDKLIKYFLKDAKLMSPEDADNADNAGNMVVDYYIPMISSLQLEINKLENYDTASADEKAAMDKRMKEASCTREELIEKLKENLESTKQDYEYVKKNFVATQNTGNSPHPFNTQINSGSVEVAAALVPEATSYLEISNGPSGASVVYKKDLRIGYLEVNVFGKVVKDDAIKLSGDAAVTDVRNTFQALGLGIMDFNRFTLDQSYAVSYSRGNVNGTLRVLTFNDTLNGIPISNVNSMETMSKLSIEDRAKEVFAPKANPPQIIAVLNEAGEIVALGINNPISMIQMENSNVETIGIDDAVNIFKDKMQGTDLVNGTKDNARVIINQIRLSLLTTAKKDDIDHVRVMPVYDFIGYEYLGDKLGQVLYPKDATSALTINAIDGSIINRTLGY